MTASVSVRFGEGETTVQSYVRLTASTRIYCCTYDDAAPILSIHDGTADITITNPGQGEVTEDDVRFGRQLAEAVTRYAAELERHAARNRAASTGAGTRAAGKPDTAPSASRPAPTPARPNHAPDDALSAYRPR